ncbi:hypothetical protein HG536_0H00640 [Torulaspora globosa]|uniref:Bul1 N-terminal domain-containing protein n=1 Tax=Torulaspora globosa TaxID=48254 RepID=A0A7G3ZMF3_9SACH|nr:uncharacterized protein HG536_0H00640 [Torulaspora globosa]QLL34689.1 hypothetical protein HG536_0H00640 [Torulaspora globosa]
MVDTNATVNCNEGGDIRERRSSRSGLSSGSKTGSRRRSRAEPSSRGRSAEVTQQPTSWIRSASTSSLLRLKRNDKIHNRNRKDKTEMNRSESLCKVETQLAEQRKKADAAVVVDVLPSFEMYNSLHRHIPQGNIDADRHDFPPCYQKVQSQYNSILRGSDQPESIALGVADPNGAGSASSASVGNLHPLSTRHLNLHEPSNVSDGELNAIEDDLNDSDNINIDKLYSLPRLVTPIEIDIRIAKHAIKPHERPEEESMLKEYTSGEIIHGYCVIENKSTQRVKFEMFYVTLEGYISVTDKQKGKRTVKRFLRMVDLSASWSYGCVDISSGIKVVPGDIDFDNTVLGLTNNRILEPGMKYKKFFMFKLPNQLLDVTCKQEQFSHCLLPPSFGIDRFKHGGKYSGIKINSILGCGHLGIKGSPILTYDMAEESLSINYTIDAKFVGKDKKTQQLNIMSEHQYHLRVIPFGFNSPVIGEKDSSRQLEDLTALVQERLEALSRVFERLKNREPISAVDIHGTDISGTVSDIQLDSEEILARKMHQLHLNNRVDPQYYLSREKDLKGCAYEADFCEAELSYKLKSKSASTLTSGIFTGFKSSQSNPNDGTKDKLNKVGLMVLKAKHPDLALPYLSPSLLRKKNKFGEKNEHDQENWLRISSLVPEEVRNKLEYIDIELECIQSNNSAPHEPPEIQSVTTELICITGKSDNSIPIKLDAKILMNQDKLQHVKRQYSAFVSEIQNYSEMFEKNLVELNELYSLDCVSALSRQLSFTDFISDQIRNDVESLANLSTSVVNLHEVFKKQAHTMKKSSQDSMSSNSSSSSLSKNGSVTFIVGSSFEIPGASTKHGEQTAREWVNDSPMHYKRTVRVNLEYSDNIKETLVPTFESCLCCRFYCVRVKIKFDNHIGTASIDIPVSVKNLHC